MVQIIGLVLALVVVVYIVNLVIAYVVPLIFLLGTGGLAFVAYSTQDKARLVFAALTLLAGTLTFVGFSSRSSQLRAEQAAQVAKEAKIEAEQDRQRREENQRYEDATREYEIKFVSPQSDSLYVAAYNEAGEEVGGKGKRVDVLYLVKGRYKLVIETDGYESERVWINVPADKLIQVDFAVKLPEPPEPIPDENEQVYFGSCAAARAAGAAPLYAGSPGYRSQLDRDKDGVACE
jgi:hypothetical protein